MRFRVVLEAKERVLLPWNYAHFLHGFIYRAITEENTELGHFLHEEGFQAESHRYKLFVFSRLFAPHVKGTSRGILFLPPVTFFVGSPLPEFLEALVRFFLRVGKISLQETVLSVSEVVLEPPPEFGEKLHGETIGPLTVSTGVKKGEKLHKVFLAPHDPRFAEGLRKNLKRKAQALGIDFPDHPPFSFQATGPWHSRLITVQGTNVRGYEGQFLLQGPEPLLRLSYDAGLGERNSQGFGMFQVVEKPSS